MKIAILTTDNREQLKDYAAAAPYFGTAPEALVQGFAMLPEAEVHVVSCARQPMQTPEKLADNVWFHELLVPRNGWTRTAFLGCARAVRKKLREIRPAIVHGQGTERDCAISAIRSGFPNVLTIHGNMRLIAKVTKAPLFSFPRLSAWLESYAVPRSQGVVCITRYTEEFIKPLNARTWVVPNAVDKNFFEVKICPPAGQPPRILCVGLICVRKNQNAFIRALDPLAQRHKFELVFLGKATPGRAYEDEFLGLVAERPWCRHAGFTDREKLKQHFSGASLLALPSLEDNCPMVILEAMATGLPVVGANVGGVPDLIEASQTGGFCDPLDAASMSAAIERVLTNPAAAWQMAAEAKKQAQARFHPRVIAARHLEIYREVLGKES
ncbi:MAG: glycosyltransferase family 1 protein [Pedosphaera sp.]|nr:glycosyltransferase family 1 protein [Pedosphaera sp.]